MISFIQKQYENTNQPDKPNSELRITHYELRITHYELRITHNALSNELPFFFRRCRVWELVFLVEGLINIAQCLFWL